MKQKLTLTKRQKWAYARWYMKDAFIIIPVFFVGLVYMGLALWWVQPFVDYYLQNPPEHWLFWQALARLTCVFGSFTAAWITIYVICFLWCFFFNKDEVLQRHFMKYHYKKKNIWTL